MSKKKTITIAGVLILIGLIVCFFFLRSLVYHAFRNTILQGTETAKEMKEKSLTQ